MTVFLRKDCLYCFILEMKIQTILSIFIFLSCFGVYSVTNPADNKTAIGYDGPYVLYTDSCVKVLSVGLSGDIKTQYYDLGSENINLNVISHNGDYSFDVKIQKDKKRDTWKYEQYDKTLVISDPHGNIDFVIKTLQGNGAIDKKLNWTFGNNHLMVIGDVFDRGNDVTQIFWLIYKLKQEAEQSGGKVSFLIGNHEPMILCNDMRYAEEKYKILADSLGINYSELFSYDTELGKWIANCNTIEVSGDYLFVHAGIGEMFYKMNVPIDVVNKEISSVLFKKNKDRKATSELHSFLYGSEGPIWYRGLVRDKEKYHPCPSDTLALLMNRLGVEKIVVGHTKNNDISEFYDGKVIGVNVENEENLAEKKGLGILIQQKQVFVVGEKGIIRKL